MYHHSFLFVIISGNNQIEESLRKISPLEDCDYIFQTVSGLQDAEVSVQRQDVAYIYDSVSKKEFIKDVEAFRERECVLVAGQGSSLLTDCAVVSTASEMWVMPTQAEYDEELLRIHFNGLVRRMKYCADARKQKICFDTLINSVPDISWFKDTAGAHLIVNNSFCDMVGKGKDQIYKKGHCYIWDASKEDEEVCLNSDRIIMESRATNIFKETIKTQTGTRLLKSYKSALIDLDGDVFGTCGIAHDETELQDMNVEMDIVLDSVPFAVLVEDMQGIVQKKNARFDLYFPQFVDIVGKSGEEWKQSLHRKLLVEGRLMEVIMQYGEENRVLVYEEEPIQDTFERTIGNIVTLTDITLEWSISRNNEHKANTDYLTGLNNRRNLMNYLVEKYTRDDVALVMIDLDNFKYVNDTYGHEAGDRALVKTAEIMRECFGEDFCARMGGDEFMVVISGKGMNEVKSDVERMMETMYSEYGCREEFKAITASIGILMTEAVPEQKRSVSMLLETVDALLYEAKKSGKNRYCVYGGDR